MNPAIKERWAKRVERSRRLATIVLRDGGLRSVLGHLAELAKQDGVGEWKWNGYVYYFLGWQSLLPPEVVAWAGLGSRNPYITLNGELYPMEYLNDEHPKQLIAAAIRNDL